MGSNNSSPSTQKESITATSSNCDTPIERTEKADIWSPSDDVSDVVTAAAATLNDSPLSSADGSNRDIPTDPIEMKTDEPEEIIDKIVKQVAKESASLDEDEDVVREDMIDLKEHPEVPLYKKRRPTSLQALSQDNVTESRYVHGKIEIYLSKAQNLINKDGIGQVLPSCISSQIRCGILGVSDPMTKVYLDNRVARCSSIKKNSLNPIWKELLSFDVCESFERLNIRLVDIDLIGEQLLGHISFSAETLSLERMIHGYFPLNYGNDDAVHFEEEEDDETDLDLHRRPSHESVRNPCSSEDNGGFEKVKSKYGWVKLIVRYTPADRMTEDTEETYMMREVCDDSMGMLQKHPNIVQDAYFKPRLGGELTFYDSADVDLLSIPSVELDDGSFLEPRRCWLDLYDSLQAATKFICICGWSVNTSIKLLRSTEEVIPTLGELLLEKAEQGVLVYVMVWDDLSSNAIKSIGFLNTYDEETFKYFKHTKVACVKIQRGSITSKSGLFYSHHQKTVIMDCEDGDKIQVKGFVGGIDLTKGRYDSGAKSLFSTLKTEHRDDYYMRCIPHEVYASLVHSKEKLGPRQPWQDAHCQVVGSSAVDLLQNYIERWRGQIGVSNHQNIKFLKLLKYLADTPMAGALPTVFKGIRYFRKRMFQNDKEESAAMTKLMRDADQKPPTSPRPGRRIRSYSDFAKRMVGNSHKLKFSSTLVLPNGKSSKHMSCSMRDSMNTNVWISQIVRSCNSDTTHFQSHERLVSPFLTKKDRSTYTDQSYQAAYIQHIRNAKHFIYIESQHFLGSCQLWSQSRHVGCNNLIPGEILMKIVSKILNLERFHVYVVVPLFPEGLPGGSACQQILRFQYRTVEMVYKHIAEAILEANIEGVTPRDYFSFCFLGKREAKLDQEEDVELSPLSAGSESTLVDSDEDDDYGAIYSRMRKNRRFQIYVHSKLLIVDDEVMVVGSANINQRSFDGDRDTEIGISCFQPFKRADASSTPRGSVYGFRIQLWAQHLGPAFDLKLAQSPSTIPCIQHMHQQGDANWEVFVAPGEPQDTPGHLMTYPYKVELDGSISPLIDSIPDYGASLIGKKSKLPNKLTT